MLKNVFSSHKLITSTSFEARQSEISKQLKLNKIGAIYVEEQGIFQAILLLRGKKYGESIKNGKVCKVNREREA